MSRLAARECAQRGWNVKIADLDVSQTTSVDWLRRRVAAAIEPHVPVEPFPSLDHCLRANSLLDCVVVDAPPHSNQLTLRIVQRSNLVVLPTGPSLDDLRPTVRLAHELVQKGIPKNRFVFVLNRVGDSAVEIAEAREYVELAGYSVLAGDIPEKVAYRRASDEGRAINETRYPSLNKRCDEVTQSMFAALERNRGEVYA